MQWQRPYVTTVVVLQEGDKLSNTFGKEIFKK
jgi:hypothetical protein